MDNIAAMCQSCSMPMSSETKVCQSCSIIMREHSLLGTEKDGSPNKEYCIYCYKNGSFTNSTITMEEIIDMYASKWGEWIGKPELSLEDARSDLQNTLSHLNRWKHKKQRTKSRCCHHRK